MATLFLMVGLPGAGKTVRAGELAAKHHALVLSPDAWMIPLFGDSMAGGKRDVLEGRLTSLALDALRLEVSVVLDFGLWSAMSGQHCAGSPPRRGRLQRSCTCRWIGRPSSIACDTAGRRDRTRRFR
jgi:hypothetical protein